jgi:hypothetical protein
MGSQIATLSNKKKLALFAIVAGTALIYYSSHPLFLFHQLFARDEDSFYRWLNLDDTQPYAWLTENNYTLRLADALLHGQLGLAEEPPSWLNETILLHGRYYSVFPLGSVLTMVPFALLHDLINVPVIGVAIALGGGLAAFLFIQISLARTHSFRISVAMSLFATLGTWLWTNTVMGGSWQLSLAFGMIGELGALYYVLVRRRPLLASAFFALAFGNRTEIIVTAPIFIYLLASAAEGRASARPKHQRGLAETWARAEARPSARAVAKFCLFPFLLGIATLAYNYSRFGSPFDFGLARLPGVLEESWYRHGVFSIHAIPSNAWQMLFQPWHYIDRPPYLLPDGFGGSVFLNAPFLLCIFRRNANDRRLRIAAWAALALLTLVFWCHGNTGGWQFSYRGAIVMLPWFYLLLLQKQSLAKWQLGLIALSIAINAYATYLFLWTNWIQP